MLKKLLIVLILIGISVGGMVCVLHYAPPSSPDLATGAEDTVTVSKQDLLALRDYIQKQQKFIHALNDRAISAEEQYRAAELCVRDTIQKKDGLVTLCFNQHHLNQDRYTGHFQEERVM